MAKANANKNKIKVTAVEEDAIVDPIPAELKDLEPVVNPEVVEETKAPVIEDEPKKQEIAVSAIPTLYFAESFWCNRLNMSIKKGTYRPANELELEILQPLATRSIAHSMTVTTRK